MNNRSMDAEDTIGQQVAGTAPDNVKRFIAQKAQYMRHVEGITGPIFGEAIIKRMKTVEVSVIEKTDEPLKSEGRVICELVVTEDMVNGAGNLHGGCSAFLIDMCSTMALQALRMAETGKIPSTVSLTLDVVYHSPAAVGDKLRIVSTSLTTGSRAHSSRSEIWNATHHRLVSSGVHVKMRPSADPPKAKM